VAALVGALQLTDYILNVFRLVDALLIDDIRFLLVDETGVFLTLMAIRRWSASV